MRKKQKVMFLKRQKSGPVWKDNFDLIFFEYFLGSRQKSSWGLGQRPNISKQIIGD
jgi:hypothetical protein